jgi:hypothetical protein
MMIGISNIGPSISYMHLLQFWYVLDVDSFFISVGEHYRYCMQALVLDSMTPFEYKDGRILIRRKMVVHAT